MVPRMRNFQLFVQGIDFPYLCLSRPGERLIFPVILLARYFEPGGEAEERPSPAYTSIPVFVQPVTCAQLLPRY